MAIDEICDMEQRQYSPFNNVTMSKNLLKVKLMEWHKNVHYHSKVWGRKKKKKKNVFEGSALYSLRLQLFD